MFACVRSFPSPRLSPRLRSALHGWGVTIVGVLGPGLRDVLDEKGYAVVPRLVDRGDLDSVRSSIERYFDGRVDGRITNAWVRVQAVRALATAPAVMRLATEALGRRAVAFQTLNFRVGTDQAPHADTIHFDTVPSGGVCAVWGALEDVGAEQGPVVVYPGSHRWPVETPMSLGLDPGSFDIGAYEALVSERIEQRGVAPVTVEMDAGDVLVWSANLVHGGGSKSPGTTRWSQVTHYVRAGDVLVTPMRSDVDRGRYRVRTVIDVADRRVVPPGPTAPTVVHSPGRSMSFVGDISPSVGARRVSDMVAVWRRARARAALARSGMRAPAPT